MFWAYPPSATENNWLHDCLVKMLKSVNTCINTSKAIPRWPTVIPKAQRDILKSRPGLKAKFNIYVAAFQKLSIMDRQKVMLTLNEQNNIIQLLSDTSCDCTRKEMLPERIISPLENLFDFAYKLLTDLGIRDELYKEVYNSIDGIRWCPFCNIERFDNPLAPREDLDHYLAKCFYPFAAANLKNLVPMGKKCNELYKQSIDVLRNNDGTRRLAFYPYGDIPVIDISLKNSIPLPENKVIFMEWKITFEPALEQCETWDSIFRIRTRYTRDILNPECNSWLKTFSKWIRKSNKTINDDNVLLNTINEYISILEYAGVKNSNFLMVKVFETISKQCEEGNLRLISYMKRLAIELR